MQAAAAVSGSPLPSNAAAIHSSCRCTAAAGLSCCCGTGAGTWAAACRAYSLLPVFTCARPSFICDHLAAAEVLLEEKEREKNIRPDPVLEGAGTVGVVS